MKEILDIYNINRELTGKEYERGSNSLKENEYVIVVEIMILNGKNEILLSQRSESKKMNPLKWETTQGSVKSKENSIKAAIREVKEELGISIVDRELHLYKTIRDDREHIFKDLFWIKKDIKLEDIHFTDGEVINAKWVTLNEFQYMYDTNQLVSNMNFNLNHIKEVWKREPSQFP